MTPPRTKTRLSDLINSHVESFDFSSVIDADIKHPAVRVQKRANGPKKNARTMIFEISVRDKKLN